MQKGPQTQERDFCGCGAEPVKRGYCMDCIRKLKGTFDRYLEKFNKLSDEYDEFTGVD